MDFRVYTILSFNEFILGRNMAECIKSFLVLLPKEHFLHNFCSATGSLIEIHIVFSCFSVTAHTPDNSFLGFVVEQHLNASDIRHINDIKRQNQSLVYGKVDNFWKEKKAQHPAHWYPW
ncbi:hypothetical protein ATANTOWER_002867 [Ataeniobius toweri]|uniref:alpha-1,6-mannosyl-glycoprotein 6-beta-N-acetylglucosaminyltransferase n=1 Tax=Ataeniobius toweri TaxID=208326 RepID=A0ABU7BM59_9TELE|nr:hypothetical protein [Ataeniobius toweri]